MPSTAQQDAILKVCKLAMEIGDAYSCSDSVAQLMAYAAKARGWGAWNQAAAPYSQNGKLRKGRIDLLMVVDGLAVGIEVDKFDIKAKSITKLQGIPSLAARLCIITRGEIDSLPEGVDAVLSIRTQRLVTREGFTVIA